MSRVDDIYKLLQSMAKDIAYMAEAQSLLLEFVRDITVDEPQYVVVDQPQEEFDMPDPFSKKKGDGSGSN